VVERVREWRIPRGVAGEIEPIAVSESDGPPVSDTVRRALLVSSPHAGNAVHFKRLDAHLRRVGIAVGERLLVSDLDHSQPQGNVWRERGYDFVIVSGGDGTVGSVATHLAGSGLPLAILPTGTANDVARSLYLPLAIEEACVALAGAVPVEIDIGQALPALTEPGAFAAASDEPLTPDTPGEPSPMAGVAFLHAVTLGLNVEFARLATDVQRRLRLGNLTYAASLLEAVTRYRPIDLRLRLYGLEGAGGASESVISSRVVQVSIINTPVFGGRIGVRLPDVSLRDRLLDVMIIEALDAGSLRAIVQRLLAAIGAAPDDPDEPTTTSFPDEALVAPYLPGVHRIRAHAAIIETDDAVDVAMDGEIRAHTPILVRVAPQRLRVLVPPQARRLLSEPFADTSAHHETH
jgi:diacylglycerol kinase (ATP)